MKCPSSTAPAERKISSTSAVFMPAVPIIH
jgi:hypothetical protein